MSSKYKYDVRQVDAIRDPDGGWISNASYHLGTLETAGDTARALRRWLKRRGISFYRGRTRTETDGDLFEITDRKTGQPLFAAVPMF